MDEAAQSEPCQAEADARYAAIVEASLDCIVSMDAGGRIVEFNPAAERTFGYSRAEAIGRDMADLIIPPAYRERHRAGLARVIATGEDTLIGRRVEITAIRAGGDEFPVELTITRIEHPGPPLFTGFIRDISGRMEMESAVKSSQLRFNLLFERSADAIFLVDEELFVDCNPAAVAMFGYGSRENLLMQHPSSLSPERQPDGCLSLEKARQMIANAFQTGTNRFEWLHRRADGTDFPVEVLLTSIQSDQKKMLYGVVREIAARKRAERELIERAERVGRFQVALMELAKSDLSELQTALRAITSEAALALAVDRVSVWFYNDDRSAIICRDLFELGADRHSSDMQIQAADVPQYFRALRSQRTIAASDAWTDPATSEFRESYLEPLGIRSMLDVPIWQRGRMIGVLCHEHIQDQRSWTLEEQDFAGSVADLVALAIESSERARAEAALQRANDELEARVTQRTRELEEQIVERRKSEEQADRANRAKNEFLSRMSHELRTPMNSILGFAQILARKSLPPDLHKNVDHILKAGRHLLELINEVLDISRIEENRMRLSAEPVGLASIVQESIALVQHLASDRGSAIRDEVSASGLFVMADRQRLTQVLVNLLSNGLKYNRAGGDVKVSCTRADAHVRIRVSDTGLGIAPENLEKLFSPFERLGAEDSEIEGTGLGLALSKRIVEVMGGRMGVETALGEGSTFWLDLPLAESPHDRIHRLRLDPAATPDLGAGRPVTILYIEDNLANLTLIETVLAEIPGLRLLVASRALTGLEMVSEHRPDLVLLDMHLPDLPGDQVLARLQNEPSTARIPVVVISADATTSHIRGMLAGGARHYLTKPIDIERFLAVVESTLQGDQASP